MAVDQDLFVLVSLMCYEYAYTIYLEVNMVSIDPKVAAAQRLAAANQEVLEAGRAYNLAQIIPDDQRLAEVIHTATCNGNHIDYCGWHDERQNGLPDWNGWTHVRALTRAHAILAVTDVDTAIAVIEALRS